MASRLPQPPSQTERAAPERCLLCVDDHPEVLSIMGEFLRVFGYSVLTAPSGARGLQLLQRNAVDAVILDYEMPRMDGARLAQKVKHRWPHLPVLMFTGYPDEVPAAVRQSVDAFVVKGEPAEHLLQVLQAVVPGHDGRAAGKKPRKVSGKRRPRNGRSAARRLA